MCSFISYLWPDFHNVKNFISNFKAFFESKNSNLKHLIKGFYLILNHLNPDMKEKVFETPFQSIIDTFTLTLLEVVAGFEDLEHYSSYVVVGEVIFLIIFVFINLMKKLKIFFQSKDVYDNLFAFWFYFTD